MEMNENNSFSSNNTTPTTTTWKKKKIKNKNKKSFSDEQIKLLESMFESETKPDPRKKVMLAKELGLQPRQVAIWFQNRRARWKSKQVEQDFRALKAKYDNLMSQFECLKKEKQHLETEQHFSYKALSSSILGQQLQKLNEVLELDRTQENTTTADGEHNNRKTEANPIDQQDDFVQRLMLSSHEDDKSSKSNNSREERCEILKTDGGGGGGGVVEEEQEVGPLGLPEKWDYSGSSCTSDYSFGNSQAWWNFWT